VQNTPLSIALARLLSKASDPDTDSLSVTAVSSTSTNGGSVVLGGASATYSPVADYVGDDLFSYVVTDTHNASATGSVLLTVISSNSLVLSPAGMPFISTGVFHSPFAGNANLTYSVDRATNLAGPWELNYTNFVAGTNGLFELVDPNNPPSAQRFFRTHYP
jgi:hypothetical protein